MIRRFGLTAYWLAFAIYTLDAARSPGLVMPGTVVRYPWDGVFATWAILGLLVGGLHAILRPRTFDRSWGRLLGAFLYSLLLIVLAASTFVTDMPGYEYVPLRFAAVTPAMLLILSAVVGLQAATKMGRLATGGSMPDDPTKDFEETARKNKEAAERLKNLGKKSAEDAQNILEIAKPESEPKKP